MKKIYTLFGLFALFFIPTSINAQDTLYSNTFTNGIGDATIVGNGAVEWDSTKGFGNVYHNATTGQAVRTNYLLLDTNIFARLQDSGKYQVSITFWVNQGTATGYFYCPLFSAYGAAPDPVNGNTWPMLVLEARLWMQHNLAGWCDYGDAMNVNGANYISTDWIADGKWHLYTMTLDTSTAKIYTDDTLRNEWTLVDTTANTSNGFFENASQLKYICLGGNQAWTWNDPDPAFKYDDVTIYSGILDSTQIAAIMAAKRNVVDTTSTTISASSCIKYTSPSGKVWTTSGTYTDTIPRTAGGDSIIHINLTINTPTIAGDVDCSGSIDVSKGEIAGDVNGDGKIDNGEIAGDVNGDGKIDNGEIMGDVNGDGKIDNGEVQGDANGDGKIDGNEVSSINSVLTSNIKIYPNPVINKLNITSDNIIIEKVQISTITGVVVMNKEVNAKQANLDLSELSSGIYIISVTTDLGQINKNIIK